MLIGCITSPTLADGGRSDAGWWQRRQQRRERQTEIRGWTDQDWEAFGRSLADDPDFQQMSERERAALVADRVGATLDEGGIVPNVSLGGRIRSGVEHRRLDAGTCSDVTEKIGAALTGAGIENGKVVVNQSGLRTWNPFNVNRDHGAPFVVIDGKRYVMDLWLHGGDRRGWVRSGSFSDFKGSGFDWMEIDDWKDIMEDAGYDLSTTEEYYEDPRLEEAREQARQNMEEAARRLGIDPEGKSTGELGGLIMDRAQELGLDPDGTKSARELAEEISTGPAEKDEIDAEPPALEMESEEEPEPEPVPETKPEAEPMEKPDLEPEEEEDSVEDQEPELEPESRKRAEKLEDPDEPEPDIVGAIPDTKSDEPDPTDDGYRPSEQDMPGEWAAEGTRPDYDAGTLIIDDAGTEFAKTADGGWVETGDTYDPITAEQKAEWDREIEQAARDLRGEEPSSPDWTGPGSGPERDSSGGLLDQFADRRRANRQQQVDTAAGSMDLSRQMGEAARFGDRQIRDARQMASAAGRDAQTIRDQAARDAAQAQREQSWGTALGDALADGVQQGMETMATTFGTAAAGEVAGQIFGPTREEREAAEAEAAAAEETQVASADEGAPATDRSAPRRPQSDDDVETSGDADADDEPADPADAVETRENPDGTVTITYGCRYTWTGKPPGPPRCPICDRETVSEEPTPAPKPSDPEPEPREPEPQEPPPSQPGSRRVSGSV